MYIRLSTVEVTTDPNGQLDVTITLDSESQIAAEGLRAKARLADNSAVASVLNGDRPSAVGEFAWAMSGSIPLIETADGQFIVLGKRDEDAPSYTHHLTTAAGFAETPRELFLPRTIAAREGAEELIYCDHDGNVYVPDVPQVRLADLKENVVGTRKDRWSRTPDDIEMLAPPKRHPPTSLNTLRPADAELIPLGNDRMTIRDPETEQEETVTGNIVVDTDESTIDIIDLLRIDLSHLSLEDLFILDGELIEGEILNRDIYLFTPDQLEKAWENGRGEYHRRFKSGHCWDGENWVDSTSAGEPGTVDPFRPVPNLDRSLGAMFRKL